MQEHVRLRIESVIEWCEMSIRALTPKIGRDEGPGARRMNEAQSSVSQLVRQLVEVGMGVEAGEIEIGKHVTVHQAVVTLSRWKKTLAQALEKVAEQPATLPKPPGPPVIDDLVTLDQVAPLTGLSKRTLERCLKSGELPEPDVRGGGGRSHKWYWCRLRPDLERVSRRPLPERFPAGRII